MFRVEPVFLEARSTNGYLNNRANVEARLARRTLRFTVSRPGVAFSRGLDKSRDASFDIARTHRSCVLFPLCFNRPRGRWTSDPSVSKAERLSVTISRNDFTSRHRQIGISRNPIIVSTKTDFYIFATPQFLLRVFLEIIVVNERHVYDIEVNMILKHAISYRSFCNR
ncbi:uncharacterized protein LOC143422671 [Xylocopa sonorina]|uniref:uncharacterized protein LOC143422671 n=1 Tax=Xylocopa sonorina TaxID=1818115 RepID=UPI00403AD7FF